MLRARVYAGLLAVFGSVAVLNAAAGLGGDWTLGGVTLTAAGGTATALSGSAGVVVPERFGTVRSAPLLAVGLAGVALFTLGTLWMTV